jgi:Carboxypeptidase regulatory-like domain
MNAIPRLPLLALIAMLPLAEPIFAQDAPVFAPATQRPRSQRVDPLTSSIRGRVTTADTGAPIRGAEVRLSMDGRFSRLVTTNGEGRYELRNLPAGAYKLTVSKSGFITLEFGQRRPFETASTIAVGEGQTAAGNVALIRGGAIYGRVLDPFGEPSIGTRVQVLRVRVEGSTRRLVSVGVGDQTDDTGAFRLYGLPPGDYYVSASTGLIDAVKRDAPVYFPGTLNFAEAQPIALGVGADASADFQIVEAARSVRVSGIVMNSAGAPAPGAMINLRSEGVTMAPNSPSALQLHDDAGPDGSFSIQNVPPGPYTLTAMLPMARPDLPTSGTFGVPQAAMREQMLNNVPETAALPIVVAGEDISGVSLLTRRGGRIKGQFVADTGVGRPLPKGLRVTLRSPGPGNMTMQMSGGNDTDFQLAGMSGLTRLDVEGMPDGWAVKSILLDGDDVTDDAFDLTGKTGNLRVVLTDRLTSLSGTVQSNRDIRDHNVVVFADDATKWTSPSRFVRTTRADAEGRFQIRGLPPGQRYLAAALDYLEDGEEQNRQLLERLRSRATSVTLGDGEQRAIQVDLIAR